MDRKIDFLLTIKLYELRRNNLEDLTLAQLKEAAFAVKWPQGLPEHLYQVAQDIEELNYYDITSYFGRQSRQLDYKFDTLEGGLYEKE